jgi:hypothetical protein
LYALAVLGQAPEVGEHRGNKLLLALILSSRHRRIKIDKVASLGGGFVPVRGRRCNELRLDLILLQPQLMLVGFDLGESPAKIGRLLGCHAAMLIEFDRLLGHNYVPRRTKG